MHRTLIILILSFTIFTSIFGVEPKGSIKGKVLNIVNKDVLVGANIIIKGTSLGSTTDMNGEFSITNIPAGSYSLECRYLGFETMIKTEIQVKPDRITFTEIELKEQSVKMNDVTVTAGYFQADEVTPTTFANLNNEEIRRASGSAMDVSRILLAMPSTAKTSDNANDLAVRGGSSAENGFYIDNIPIPNINHFPSEGATGGPIGILDVNFIEDVNFYTSGFAASYGDRLSSVVDIKFREGNKEQYNFQTDFNMAGFGGSAEGPLPEKKGSWLISAKKSYLDLVVGAIGTGVAPRYGDVQTKVVYNINNSHKITFLEIFAQSNINFTLSKSLEDKRNEYGSNDNIQNTAGINWSAIWNKNLYSNTSVSYSLLDTKGEFSKVLTRSKLMSVDNYEGMFVFRNVNYLQLNKSNKLEFGAEIKNELGEFNRYRAVDTTRIGAVIPEERFIRNIYPLKAGLYVNYITNPIAPLTFSLGVRSDYYSLNEKVPLSPRLSVSYAVNNQLKIYGNTGIFYQQLPMIVIAPKSEYKKLTNVTAAHYGIGFEYLLTPDTKLTIEAYDKEYSKLPLEPSDPTLSVIDEGSTNSRFGIYNNLQSTGKAYTRGVELLLQKKLAKDIYGLISGSYFRSKYQDYNGTWRNRIYDNKYIFSAIGGYKLNSEWEFTIKWTYAGGCPYTPFDENLSRKLNLGIIDQSRINSERYSDYHTLNLGVEKKFFFNTQSLDLYFTVMNSYNRKNISGYYWNSVENKKDTEYQWSLLPIIGVEYDF
jgi:hypothetical protein